MSYSNGRYPDSALAAIPGGRLRKDAALRWNAMCMYLRAHGRPIPMPNGSQSSYRTYAGQVLMRQMWCARGNCGNAAVPGTSNHGIGISVDNNQGYIIDSVPQFGFHRRHSDAPWESWHRTWGGYGPTPVYSLGYRALRFGARGRDVVELKRLLHRIRDSSHPTKRCWLENWSMDPRFGLRLRKSVRGFQRRRGLHADGVVGPTTLRAMRRAAI